VHAIVLVGGVRAGLHPQLLPQTALCLLQACRARTRDRPCLFGAFLIELAFGLAQPATTALAGREMLEQLVAALLAIELILGGVDFGGLFEDLPCDLIEVGVRFAARVRMDLRAVDGDRADVLVANVTKGSSGSSLRRGLFDRRRQADGRQGCPARR